MVGLELGRRKTRKRRPSGCSPIDEQVGVEAFRPIASRFGQQIQRRRRILDRVPAEVRADWMTTVAIGYSQTDPEGGSELDHAVPGRGRVRSRRRCDAQTQSQYDPRGAAEFWPRSTLPRRSCPSVMVKVAQPMGHDRPVRSSELGARIRRCGRARGGAYRRRTFVGELRYARGANWALELPIRRKPRLRPDRRSSFDRRDGDLDQHSRRLQQRQRAPAGVMSAVSAVAQRDSAEARRHHRGLSQRSGHAPAGRADARRTPGRGDDELGARDTCRTVSRRRAAVYRAVPCRPPAIPCVRRSTAPAARTARLARAHATGSNCGNQIRSVTP